MAGGYTKDMILSLTGYRIGGQLFITLKPWDWYRERYWAIFINGVWTGKNYYVHATGDLVIAFPHDSAQTIVSVWACEVGQWESFQPNSIPLAEVELEEESQAKNLLIKWVTTYSLSAVTGDAQLSSIVIRGARRGRNVGELSGQPQRGRLTYSILGNVPNAGDRLVRWYAGDRLVAEGTRNGDGALTCTAKNGAAIEMDCAVTYSADLPAGAALIDIKWPKTFQIHYSTSALAYPRVPEKTQIDKGADEYFYLVPELASGAYNYNVLQVDDEGNVQTAISAPSDSPKTVNAPPAAPTITNVTGNAATPITVTWTNGVPGCTTKLYYGGYNEPINFGTRATPAPVGPSAVDATSASLPVLAFPTGIDHETAYGVLQAAFDAAVATASAAFDAGESGFSAAMVVLDAALEAAVDVWAAELGMTLEDEKAAIAAKIASVIELEAGVVGLALSTSNWKDIVGSTYGGLLLFLGAILEGQSGRYVLPGGILPGSPAGSGTATSNSADGFAGGSTSFFNSLKSIGEPFLRNNIIRIIARATKGGVEEHNDVEYLYEIDTTGSAKSPRPNLAQLKAFSFSGGNLSVTIGVTEDDAYAAATDVDLYVVAKGAAIVLAAAVATGALPAALGGYHEKTVTYAMPGNGWYDIAVVARSAAGARSESYQRLPVVYSNDVPVGVSSVSAKVIRGRGTRPEEV